MKTKTKESQTEIKKFSEVAKIEPIYEGAQYITDKEQLKEKTLVFREFTEQEGSNGRYATVLAELDGKQISFSIGGVVFDQLIKNKERLPFEALLTEVKSKDGKLYYTLQ